MTAKPDQESMSSKDVLYGCDLAGHSIVVVEGPADVWAIGPGAVAVFGLNLSEVQLQEIGAYPVRSICFDKGSTAQRQADRIAERLTLLPGDTNIIEIESGDDPAEMDEDEKVELRRRFLTK